MDNLDFNQLLERDGIAESIKNYLADFEKNKNDFTKKRGFYIYGAPGVGKTMFITELLTKLGYDVIKYDAGDIRNKSIIDTITKHNMSDKNVISLFGNKPKNLVIIMDEIDGMNNGDKGGINSLIKLIRPKKTKKQRLEDVTHNPIFCISNYHVDKKIKELMKVCHNFEIKFPNSVQITTIIHKIMPEINDILLENIILFVQNDLRKLASIYDIYKNHFSILKNEIIQNIFKPKTYSEDTKMITRKLINNKYNLEDHITIMNETDRTIVGLLWHENIIDPLENMNKQQSIPLYYNLLKNFCFSDYIDRITFQKQIWQFNEMSSLLKTFYNNKIFHGSYKKKQVFNPDEVRFTKVLTKYSTEYNNSQFIQMLCQRLSLDKKDMLVFFIHLRNIYDEAEIYTYFETYEINKLDINRVYRFIDSYLILT